MACNCLDIDDFSDVYMSCESVKPNWLTLATYLKVHRPTVQAIESKGLDPAKCLHEVLSAWLRVTPKQPKPSWRSLRDALAGMGEVALSERIRTCGCGLCNALKLGTSADESVTSQQNGRRTEIPLQISGSRATPVAKAVRVNDTKTAATELKKLFVELMEFLHKEIRHVDLPVDTIRFHISQYFVDEEDKVDDKIEQHLSKIEHFDTANAILNYFIRSYFIGYINYSLVKVFQKLAKSRLLDKRIEEYEKDYQCFLELSLTLVHDAFQHCPDLRPDYPAGIPKFTIHLESEWDGKSVFELKDFLRQCFNNSDCIDQLMVARISRNCIIITFAVLPHITQTLLRYLTNDDVISTLKKAGITIDISVQLMKYHQKITEEKEAAVDSIAMEIPPESVDELQIPGSMVFEVDQTKDELERKKLLSACNQVQEEEHQETVFCENKRKGFFENISRAVKVRKVDDELSIQNEWVELWKTTPDSVEIPLELQPDQNLQGRPPLAGILSVKPGWDVTTDTGYTGSIGDTEGAGEQRLIDELREDVSLKEAVDAYEYDRNRLKRQIKELEIQLQMHKNMALEVDQTKDELQSTKLSLAQVQKELVVQEIRYVEIQNNFKGLEKENEFLLSVLRDKIQSDIVTEDKLNEELFRAVTISDEKRVKILIELGAGINASNDEGETPLHIASSYGLVEMVQLLISCGALVDVASNHEYGQTPLHNASSRGHTAVVQVLLSHEAAVDSVDKHGMTPLHSASMNGHPETVEWLISHGAGVDVQDKFGRTPLCTASKYAHSNIINILLSHGATVNITNNEGYTPLYVASWNNRSDVVNILLSHGATVNIRDHKDLSTPLHRCLLISRLYNVDVTAGLLIANGADLYQEDKYNQSPILIATVLGKEHLLLSNGVSEDTIAKYRLPQGWVANYGIGYSDQVEYTNTVTGTKQFTHPLFQ